MPTQTLDCIWAEPGTDRDTIQPGCIYVPASEHPDVRVELIDGQITSGAPRYLIPWVSPQYRAFRGGNGADLLVLDGLPGGTLYRKGILEDMKDFLSPMIASGELTEQVSKALYRGKREYLPDSHQDDATGCLWGRTGRSQPGVHGSREGLPGGSVPSSLRPKTIMKVCCVRY